MNAKQETKSNVKSVQKESSREELKEKAVTHQSKTVKTQTKDKKAKDVKKKDTKITPFKYIYHLLLTEKAIDHISTKNTLVFIVDLKARKTDIKREVENIFKVKVKKVNTLIDRKGRKKAYVALMPEYSAEEVATQLGMM